MTENHAITQEVQEALTELSQYLSDQLAPLMVASSIELLIGQDPDLVADRIHTWAASQYDNRNASVPVSDYLFHAVKKLHMIGEFHLVEANPLNAYIARLAPIVSSLCPEEDREMLESNIARLGRAETVLSAPVGTIYRQAGSEGPLASSRQATSTESGTIRRAAAAPLAAMPPPAMHEIARGVQRFNRLLEQLEKAGASKAAPKSELAPELIAAAATGSNNGQEFEDFKKRLRASGIDVADGQLFRALGKKLPDWAVPTPKDLDDTTSLASTGGIIGAMRRVITMAESPAESGARFREMVAAAVEQVNEGALARAVTMLELAERITTREKVDRSVVEAVRTSAHQSLDMERVRTYTEKPEKRVLLKRILGFFPRLSPKGLLEDLRGERKRETRRLLLALLEVHGTPARNAALDTLEDTLGSSLVASDWYFQRNLLYVLRRVARPTDQFIEAEIGFLDRLSDARQPPPLAKEALANLGQIHHEKAEIVFLHRLRAFEEQLLHPQPSNTVPVDELRQLLDRAVAGLGRQGTGSAIRAVVEHALKAAPPLGDAVGRLSALAGLDLSATPDVVDRLLKALKAELPVKVFGLAFQNATPNAGHLINALSATPAPGVRQAFEDISRRFPDRELGRSAHKALLALDAPKKAAESTAALQGDLEIFGLPTLFQTLESMQATGILTLRGPRGDVLGSLTFELGKLRASRVGLLSGAEAVYQLLERPAAGQFQFVRQTEVRPKETPFESPQEVVPLLLEGMRRYDEFQRATALVPDKSVVRAGPARATPVPEERDPALLQALWAKASAGASVPECESTFRADSFRIRHALVHWVVEGSLVASATE